MILLRHPATRAVPGLCYGRSDPGPALPVTLSARRRRLRSLNPAHIISSPLPRCRSFAEALAPRYAGSPRISLDERWQELDFGDWEEQRFDTLPRPLIDRWAQSPWDFQPPGGEAISALVRRVHGALTELLRRPHTPGPTLIVSHAGPIRAALGLAGQHPQSQWLSTAVPYATPLFLEVHHLADPPHPANSRP